MITQSNILEWGTDISLKFVFIWIIVPIIFILYVFNIFVLICFLFFQELAKEVVALYKFTISELNITIKIAPETVEHLPLFTDYVESWRVTYWETAFFKLFKSNDGILKNKTFNKQHGGLQAMRRLVYKFMWYLSWIYFIFGILDCFDFCNSFDLILIFWFTQIF